jgi:hypothetical protein
MSSLATSNAPNKETSSGEGQRRDIYYMAWAYRRKRQSNHSVHLQGTDLSFRLNRGRIGQRGDLYIIIKQSLAKCDLADYYYFRMAGIAWSYKSHCCLGGDPFYQGSAVLLFLSLGVISVTYYKDVIDQSCPSWKPK